MARDPVTGQPHAYADRALAALVQQITRHAAADTSALGLEAIRILRTCCRRAAERTPENHIREDLYAAHADLNAWLPADYPPRKEPV